MNVFHFFYEESQFCEMLKRADQMLAFLDDLSLSFTNDLVAYCTPSA